MKIILAPRINVGGRMLHFVRLPNRRACWLSWLVLALLTGIVPALAADPAQKMRLAVGEYLIVGSGGGGGGSTGGRGGAGSTGGESAAGGAAAGSGGGGGIGAAGGGV